jgi:tRNA A37 methylthiotransferase MiaB
MIQALRRIVKIKSGGRIEIPVSELNEEMDAEVIVLVQEPSLMEAQDLPMQKAIAKVQAMVRRHVPEGYSLSEELIQERHREYDCSKNYLHQS